MAGIGFELRRMAREEGLLRPVASAGHGAFVAAGPWLLTILALKLVQAYLPASKAAAYDLQSLIIHVFCLSLLATGPVVTAGLRLCADDLYLGRPGRIRAVYLATQLVATLAGAALAFVVLGLVFGWRGEGLLAGCAATAATAGVWPAAAFGNAIRELGAITRAFVAGLGLSVAATLLAAEHGLGADVQALAFAAGLWLAGLLLTARILATFPAPMTSLAAPLRLLLGTFAARRAVVLGALASVVALWIDSWIFWLGPAGHVSASGLPTAPFYDSAMFVARLTMLPGLVLFVGAVDTGVFAAMRRFLETIEGHGTLARIEAERRALTEATNRLLLRLILVQALVSAIVVMLAPALVAPAGLLFQQVALLRYGALGAFFTTVFFAATTLLLLLGQEKRFLLAQVSFLAANAAGAVVTLRLGEIYYGFGALAAAAVAAVLAVALLHDALERVTLHTFERALDGARRPKPAAVRAPSRWPPVLAALRARLAGLAHHLPRSGKAPT
ncbi:pellicle/biofilm biosynthesis Wzx-like polysaccharide transporter PelG [Aureimonas endophytica]|uniref:Pellicle/biofilm biosynthesis Wzx-like polysaccharide transporter PelG n=1 Tax=Aureimonas endophytica TaxID=2027858 RepID=A0A916ZDP9_9HYPH|nr:exopolysaccharide Pel transporter PelG [Aureimonas endophytica]GGD90327.1 pellicle/biofilm biosynthesis Wzx-like polysaccharide transporter PelG [Aureimonas endophytica]